MFIFGFQWLKKEKEEKYNGIQWISWKLRVVETANKRVLLGDFKGSEKETDRTLQQVMDHGKYFMNRTGLF